jgi:hypothetical protein
MQCWEHRDGGIISAASKVNSHSPCTCTLVFPWRDRSLLHSLKRSHANLFIHSLTHSSIDSLTRTLTTFALSPPLTRSINRPITRSHTRPVPRPHPRGYRDQVLYALGSVGDPSNTRWAGAVVELLHKSIRETNNLARSLPGLNLLGRLLHTYVMPCSLIHRVPLPTSTLTADSQTLIMQTFAPSAETLDANRDCMM